MDKTVYTSSVYCVTELIGTSESSWEDAAKHAVETATKSGARRARGGSEQTRFGDRRWQSHRFPRAGESVVQARRERPGFRGEEGGYQGSRDNADLFCATALADELSVEDILAIELWFSLDRMGRGKASSGKRMQNNSALRPLSGLSAAKEVFKWRDALGKDDLRSPT